MKTKPASKPKITIKEYIIVRENGRIVSMREKTADFGIRAAKQKYSADKSLSKDVKITFLTNVKEIVDMRSRPKPRVKSYQVVATIIVNGEQITARSDKREWASVSDAKQNALNKLYGIVSFREAGESDKELGENIVKSLGTLRTGVVYYEQREVAQV